MGWLTIYSTVVGCTAHLFQRGLAHGVVGDVEVVFAVLEELEQAGQSHLRWSRVVVWVYV